MNFYVAVYPNRFKYKYLMFDFNFKWGKEVFGVAKNAFMVISMRSNEIQKEPYFLPCISDLVPMDSSTYHKSFVCLWIFTLHYGSTFFFPGV